MSRILGNDSGKDLRWEGVMGKLVGRGCGKSSDVFGGKGFENNMDIFVWIMGEEICGRVCGISSDVFVGRV